MINIEMYLPPIELQYEFAARVQQVEALKAKLKVSLATAEEQFKALIQQAFTKRADAVGLAK
jgi:type I restriction enzyme S subunit